MLAAAVDMLAEPLGEAEVAQMPVQPARRTRRSDGDRQVRWQQLDEIDRADDRANPFLESADALLPAPLVEPGRQRAADPLLDRREELWTAVADKIANRVLRRGAVPEVGQQLGELFVALELAFKEHAVEVEDDRVEVGHESSNNEVPTRTALVPSITALWKSADIPMLKPVTSWRRASFARSAK